MIDVMLIIIDDEVVEHIIEVVNDEIDINEWLIYVIKLIEAIDLQLQQVEIVVILVIDIVFIDLQLIEHSVLLDNLLYNK